MMILILEGEESVYDYDLMPAIGRDHSGTVTVWASPQAYANEQVLKPLREQVQARRAADIAPLGADDPRAFWALGRNAGFDAVLALLDGGET